MSDTDDNDLRLLATFHYVVAAFVGLIGCFPSIHLTIGVLMVRGDFGEPGKDQPPAFVGYLFIGVALLIMSMAFTMTGFLIYAARCINARRRHMLCMVVAGFSCMFMPFGTVLGIFTLMVLQRPTVRARFS